MEPPVDTVEPNIGPVEIEKNPENYGRAAAEGILRLVSGPVPEKFQGETVREDEGRFASPEKFFKVWDRADSTVFDPSHDEILQNILGGNDDSIETRIREIRSQTEALISRYEPKGTAGEQTEFFVPFNADPQTLIVLTQSEGPNSDDSIGVVEYTDHNNLGKARNPVLAQLASLSNFYGRLHEKPEAQRAFLKAIVESGKSEDARRESVILAEAVAAFGSIYMAKYPMKEADPQEDEQFYLARNLLGSLQGNLDSITAPGSRRQDL